MVDFWMDFWGVFFFVSLGLFAVLSVFVAIGGFFNIRDLFKTIKLQHSGKHADVEGEDDKANPGLADEDIAD